MDATASLPACDSRVGDDAAAPVWLLLGSKQGDNSQILALAEALGLPYRPIALRFNPLRLLLPALLGRSLCSVRNRQQLRGPGPRLVISSGLRSVAAARWVQHQQQQRGEPCQLVHLGRPWGPPAWFDLIVTTPQYALSAGPNVRHNLLPLLADARPQPAPGPALSRQLRALPRPWTVVLLGGHSRPLRFTPEAALALAATLNSRSGSVLVLGSPRTPAACIEALAPALTVPHLLVPFGDHPEGNPYPALRALADDFVVTSDSVQMAAELLVCGKPLQVFPLPERPDVLVRLTRAWRDLAARWSVFRPAFDWMRHRGLLSSLRDVALFHQQLDAAGAYRDPDLARQLRTAEKTVTVHRIQQLLRNQAATASAAPAGHAPRSALRQP